MMAVGVVLLVKVGPALTFRNRIDLNHGGLRRRRAWTIITRNLWVVLGLLHLLVGCWFP